MRIEKGKEGELAAEHFLLKKGYRILQRNFRSKFGEIDLVVQQHKVIVFVEVKAYDTLFMHPAEAISKRKQRHLTKTANWYRVIQQCPGDLAFRFDLVAVRKGEVVDHLENLMFD